MRAEPTPGMLLGLSALQRPLLMVDCHPHGLDRHASEMSGMLRPAELARVALARDPAMSVLAHDTCAGGGKDERRERKPYLPHSFHDNHIITHVATLFMHTHTHRGLFVGRVSECRGGVAAGGRPRVAVGVGISKQVGNKSPASKQEEKRGAAIGGKVK